MCECLPQKPGSGDLQIRPTRCKDECCCTSLSFAGVATAAMFTVLQCHQACFLRAVFNFACLANHVRLNVSSALYWSLQGTAPGATVQARCPHCGTTNQARHANSAPEAAACKLLQAAMPHTGGSPSSPMKFSGGGLRLLSRPQEPNAHSYSS